MPTRPPVHVALAAAAEGALEWLSSQRWPFTSPAATPSATLPPTPTPTPTEPAPRTPSPAETPICSLDAAYVADVTIPDHTEVATGSAFTKAWRIRNTGTCVWGEGYELRHVGGEMLAASAAVAVRATEPGDAVEAAVPMTAPASAGRYRSDWRMCLAGGECFGETVYVLIVAR